MPALSEAHRGGIVTERITVLSFVSFVVCVVCVCALCARPAAWLGAVGNESGDAGHSHPLALTLAVSPTPAWYLQGDPSLFLYF